MLILIPPLPNVCIPCVEVEQKVTNIALSISFKLLNKAIFYLGGLEFVQKMWNYMPLCNQSFLNQKATSVDESSATVLSKCPSTTFVASKS